MPHTNKEEQKAYRRKWYKQNRKSEYDRIKLRLKDMTRWYQELKASLSCERCGEDHVACLDFHHEEKKDMEVSRMAKYGYGKERILKEIDKCTVLCSNCHRKLHWNQRDNHTSVV